MSEFDPLADLPGSDASTFIQWKGTDVCLDFYCPCGAHGHLDADFAYWVRCAECRCVFRLGTQVMVGRDDSEEAALRARDLA